MKRLIAQQLLDWKSHPRRKPLILEGVRQCGKTHSLESFGQSAFANAHIFNFESQQDDLHDIFNADFNPRRIIDELSFYQHKPINIHEDVLIFDELQACPRAITSLKYFCEKMPEMAVCAAGSLLGLKLNDASFPVGKVDMLSLHPLSFIEFLWALGDNQSAELIQACTLDSTIAPVVHAHIWERLKWYFITGGLPEAIQVFCEHRDNLYVAFEKVREKQHQLIKAYYADIAKHAGKENAMHIERVWSSVPKQLANIQNSTSQRFQFTGIIPGIDRYQRLVGSIDWLTAANLVHKTSITSHVEHPISAFCKENLFKLYVCDVGLLGAMTDLPPQAILNYDYGTYKGYFAENFVAQELKTAGLRQLICWQQSRSEIEFLFAQGADIIPLEVKAGHIQKAKSLKKYVDLYHPPHHVILSAQTLNIDRGSGLHQYPLYLASQLPIIYSQS
ncbi:MAG: ATPase [marine bacterium B5-7]|nr:MAG: ATPase [marine bacterium B5-7]